MTTVQEVVLHVDSRGRDVKKYPSPCSYVVDLPETLRDVLSVELVYASYATSMWGGGEEEGDAPPSPTYLVLSVAELEPNIVSCSQGSHHAFTHLPLGPHLAAPAAALTYSPRTHYRSIRRFQPQPRASIARLTIRIGVDGSGGVLPPPPTFVKDHVLRFEIRFLVGSASADDATPSSPPRGRARQQGTGSSAGDGLLPSSLTTSMRMRNVGGEDAPSPPPGGIHATKAAVATAVAAVVAVGAGYYYWGGRSSSF